MDYLSQGTKSLPNVLQEVVLEYFRFKEVYFEAYDWYSSLVGNIKTSGNSETLHLLPREKLLKYLEIFLEDSHHEAVEAITEHYPLEKNNELLVEVAQKGYLEMVKFLVSHGVSGLILALDRAAEEGHLEVVKYLVSQGVKDLEIVLCLAAGEGHLEVVKYLISQAVSQEVIDLGMCWAADGGHLEVLKYLVSQGGKDLDWAFYKATERGHLEVVKYLASQGATDLFLGLIKGQSRGNKES